MKQGIKNIIRHALHFIGWVLYVLKRPKVYLRLSEKNKHVFFGYYDVSPFSDDNTRILAQQYSPEGSKSLEVGYYDLLNSSVKFIKLAETNCWCWQQGCRLRWYRDNSRIIFNTMVNDNFGSIIYNLNSKIVERKLSFPIYDLNKDGSLGASLNFTRLEICRPGYGYGNFIEKEIVSSSPDDDGLFLINIENNDSTLIVSLSTLKECKPRPSMEGCIHYINHIFFSPCSKYIFFFHLWGRESFRDSRLFRFEIDTMKLDLLIDETVSHYTWMNHNNLLLTVLSEGNIQYKLYDIDGKFESALFKNILTKDGHPSFSSNENFFITDTYPDLLGYRKISQYFIKEKKTKTLGRFFSLRGISKTEKIDLHPRLNSHDNMICIDVADRGKREMALLKLNSL